MAEAITPPDMIGAGVAAPQQAPPDASSLMAQLRPPTDMAGLAAMPRQSPGQAYAQALAGGVAQMQGTPNPVMQQQAAQQQQAMQYQKLYQNIMDQRRQREEGILTISKDLLNSESEEARMVGARGILEFGKKNGLPVQNIEPLIKSMALRRADSKEMAGVLQEFAMGVTPELVAARHPNVPPDTLRALWMNRGNNDARKIAGLPSIEDEQKKILDIKKTEADLRESDLKEWRAKNVDIDDASLPYVAQYVMQTVGIPLRELDAKNPAHQKVRTDAITFARQQIAQNDPRRLQLEETKRHNLSVEGRQAEELDLKRRELKIKEALGPGGGKPLSAEAVTGVIGQIRIGSAVNTIEGIRSDPAKKKIVENYIGPYASQWITAQRMAPRGALGTTPQEVIDLEQGVASLKNYTIKLLTGAQMSEKEAERIANELFDMTLPPDQFWRRYDNGRRVVDKMRKVVEAGLITGDRRALEALLQAENIAVPTETTTSPLTPKGGMQDEYNALRKGGMTPEQAKETLRKRGYTVR